MIDASRLRPAVLLRDLQRLLGELEADLRERVGELADLDAGLRSQHREAKANERTALAYEIWRDEHLTQVAAAWVLGTVFVRFLEDNELVSTPRLSVSGERRQRALDEHTLFFRQEGQQVLRPIESSPRGNR